jgi:hypothetical protein
MKRKLRGTGWRHTIGSVVSFAGLWMVVTNAAVLVVAAMGFFHLVYVTGDVGGRERTLVLETALTVLCVVALGLFTTNRLAGPWVALRRVCDTVHGGEPGVRLVVRATDAAQVHQAAESFNRMLNGVETRLRDAEGAALFASIESAS